MCKLLIILILVGAAPLTSWASSTIDFRNIRGKAYFGSGIFSTPGSGSVFASIQGLSGKSDVGKTGFKTQALDGSLLQGGTFASGGSVTIEELGKGAAPGGTLFTGTFSGPSSGPSSWTAVKVNGIYQFPLKGTVSGTWMSVQVATGLVALHLSGTPPCPACMHFSGGDVDNALPVPEPGTLSLLGAGLVALAGAVRSRRRA